MKKSRKWQVPSWFLRNFNKENDVLLQNKYSISECEKKRIHHMQI
jgi:hypothetical protein